MAAEELRALWLPTVERIATVMADAYVPGFWALDLEPETRSIYRAAAAAALDEVAKQMPSHVRRLMESNALHMEQRDEARADVARLRTELGEVDEDVHAERTADAASGQSTQEPTP